MALRLSLCSAPVSIAVRYGDFSGAANTQPSFGLVCLAAAARREGADVQLVEAASEDMSVDRAAREIIEFRPDIVGVSATTVGIAATWELCSRIREWSSEVAILVGGPHVTALPEETLARCPAVDLVVMREGEATLRDILGRLRNGREALHGIPGTAERRDGNAVMNEPRPFIEDLDELPLPAWDLLRGFPKAFRPSPARIRRWPCASIVLTRGCPNRCTFCDRSVFGRHCRAYSPARAVEIVRDLCENYGINEILLEDDTFIISKNRVEQFCRGLIQNDIRVSWSCLGRADRVDPELLRLMRRAGCWHISYGIESGDPQILESVNKNLDIDQITQALVWSRSAGMRTKGFFMVGFPGETPESVRKTVDLVRRLPMDDISVMQLTPFPGTQLYGTAAGSGSLDSDWSKMNTLNTVFVPKGSSAESIEKARAAILKAFYSRPTVLLRNLRHAAVNPRLLIHMLRALPALLKIIQRR